MKISEQTKQVVFSYARAALASVLAVAWAGETSVSALVKAALVAVVPPIIRWANPNDTTFGKGA